METIQLEKLTPEQKKQLMADLMAEEEAKQKTIKAERDIYKETVGKTVAETIKEMEIVSSLLSKAKANVFNNFSALLDMKKELYGYKEGQQSHTFTNALGQSIEVGYRQIDGWDDTVEAGIAKVNSYIDSLATNAETAKLVKVIQSLLKKDQKGNLKSNRVLELQNLADELDSPLFTDGVNIIREAYKPVRSAYFIEASYKDETGKKVTVPLSITTVEFPEGANVKIDAL
ncbi:DUF3164 family protein [Carboxylicivirga linearis]|uniref:DUF3164 family protein n=1 Tax=Carboxylicivirga linearis TaxID=1628157 RepID=A0ABS5K0J6_9BACT|nr:DUF3164 family protein [Carboxylicivirga linearis]MBS2100683.1 DUF3164 family protein [Carboxylicivirga linearis]